MNEDRDTHSNSEDSTPDLGIDHDSPELKQLLYRSDQRNALISRLSIIIPLFILGLFLSSNFTDIFRVIDSRLPPSFLFYARLVINSFIFLLLLLSSYLALQYFLEFGGYQRSQSPSVLVREPSVISRTLVVSDTSANSDASPRPGVYSPMASTSIERLTEEIRAQRRSATTNLAFGLITAGVSLTFLAWLAWITSIETTDAHAASRALGRPQPDYVIYWGTFASKIALSVAANVFAFFFLSTYRRNLSEIRYFQNELTNIEIKFFSLFYAKESGFADAQQEIVLELSSTERNFILKRGETTSDVALKKLDATEIERLTALLAAVGKLDTKDKPA